jgi:hypothetical protein
MQVVFSNWKVYPLHFGGGLCQCPTRHFMVAWLAARLTKQPVPTTSNWFICPKDRLKLFIGVLRRARSGASPVLLFGDLVWRLNQAVAVSAAIPAAIPAAISTDISTAVYQLACLAPHLRHMLKAMNPDARKRVHGKPVIELQQLLFKSLVGESPLTPEILKLIIDKFCFLHVVKTVDYVRRLMLFDTANMKADEVKRIAAGPLEPLMKAMFAEIKGRRDIAESQYNKCSDLCQPMAALRLAKMLSCTVSSPDVMRPICEQLLAATQCDAAREWVVDAIKRTSDQAKKRLTWLSTIDQLPLPQANIRTTKGWLKSGLTVCIRQMEKTLGKRSRDLKEANSQLAVLETMESTAPIKRKRSQVAVRAEKLKSTMDDLGKEIADCKHEREVLKSNSKPKRLKVEVIEHEAPKDEETSDEEPVSPKRAKTE